MRKILLFLIILTLQLNSGFTQKPDNINKNGQKIPKLDMVPINYNIFYSVQVGVFFTPRTADQLLNVKNLYYTKVVNGNWRYISGIYRNKKEAIAAKKEIINKGIIDAFIVVFNKNLSSKIEEDKNIKKGYISLSNFTLDSLKEALIISKKKYEELTSSLNKEISSITLLKKKTENEINKIQSLKSQRSLYWIIIIIAFLIAIIAILLYIFIKNKLKLETEAFNIQMNITKESFAEEINQTKQALIEDNNQTKRLAMLNRVINTLPLSNGIDKAFDSKKLETQLNDILSNSDPKEMDHTLPVKLAMEISNMRLKFLSLPENTPGKKQLYEIINKLEKQFNKSNYEIVNLEGKPFEKGMKLIANFIPSNDLKPGEEIITKVIKPQVNYKGEIIQTAEVDVSIGK
ncbi:MAG: SPOR domain-containing protein [Bacteroidales bacterium]|nr:SPOR domain-containing protein [Bacteroidales bacterium]